MITLTMRLRRRNTDLETLGYLCGVDVIYTVKGHHTEGDFRDSLYRSKLGPVTKDAPENLRTGWLGHLLQVYVETLDEIDLLTGEPTGFSARAVIAFKEIYEVVEE